MRMSRLALLLAVSVPLFADQYAPWIVARHRPMHPDNAQVVTFEATAAADRVVLSYTRSILGIAADGSHVQTPAEAHQILKVCDPPGTLARITCTHTMPYAFPASSLITYTATAVYADGFEAEETYSFAAGDFPWIGYPIPIRLKGNTLSKLDTVFVLADINVPMESFRDQLDDTIELYFRYTPLFVWRGMHNYYYAANRGAAYPSYCTFTRPEQYERLRVIADALVFFHATGVRNCANLPHISAKIGEEKGLVHESAHAWYRLQDEYCCDSNYRPQPCKANIYGSLAACEADAPNLGYPISYCTQLRLDPRILNIWRNDPSTEPPCIMGPNQNKATSLFRAACQRRMIWRYHKCLAGDCMSLPDCR